MSEKKFLQWATPAAFGLCVLLFGFLCKRASVPAVVENETQIVALQPAMVTDKQESEGDRKLRELGFDPKSGHPITMVIKSTSK